MAAVAILNTNERLTPLLDAVFNDNHDELNSVWTILCIGKQKDDCKAMRQRYLWFLEKMPEDKNLLALHYLFSTIFIMEQSYAFSDECINKLNISAQDAHRQHISLPSAIILAFGKINDENDVAHIQEAMTSLSDAFSTTKFLQSNELTLSTMSTSKATTSDTSLQSVKQRCEVSKIRSYILTFVAPKLIQNAPILTVQFTNLLHSFIDQINARKVKPPEPLVVDIQEMLTSSQNKTKGASIQEFVKGIHSEIDQKEDCIPCIKLNDLLRKSWVQAILAQWQSLNIESLTQLSLSDSLLRMHADLESISLDVQKMNYETFLAHLENSQININTASPEATNDAKSLILNYLLIQWGPSAPQQYLSTILENYWTEKKEFRHELDISAIEPQPVVQIDVDNDAREARDTIQQLQQNNEERRQEVKTLETDNQTLANELQQLEAEIKRLQQQFAIQQQKQLTSTINDSKNKKSGKKKCC